jgi:hypothetical protein
MSVRMRQVYLMHIMKTAGTTLRMELQRALRHGVYPTGQELKQNEHGWYTPPEELAARMRGEAGDEVRADLASRRVICGHYVWAFAEAFPVRPVIATMVREPVARTISMLAHKRRYGKELRGAGVHQLLDHEEFVSWQVREYQTKVFAHPDPLRMPNLEHMTDEAALAVAVDRLRATGFVGLTERYGESMEEFRRVAGIRLPGHPERRNEGVGLELSASELDRVRGLVRLDGELYREATAEFKRRRLIAGRVTVVPGWWPGVRRRLGRGLGLVRPGG